MSKYNYDRTYIREHPKGGTIQIRTSVHKESRELEWPRIGWLSDGDGGLSPEDAIDFANALIAKAKEIQKKELENKVPENWPPQNGDVWQFGEDEEDLHYYLDNQFSCVKHRFKDTAVDLLKNYRRFGWKLTLKFRVSGK